MRESQAKPGQGSSERVVLSLLEYVALSHRGKLADQIKSTQKHTRTTTYIRTYTHIHTYTHTRINTHTHTHQSDRGGGWVVEILVEIFGSQKFIFLARDNLFVFVRTLLSYVYNVLSRLSESSRRYNRNAHQSQ